MLLNLLTVQLLLIGQPMALHLKQKPQKLRNVHITLPFMPHQSSIDLLFTQPLKPNLKRLPKSRPNALQHTIQPQCPTDHQPQFDQFMQLLLKLKPLRLRKLKLIVLLFTLPHDQLPTLPRKLTNPKDIPRQCIVLNRFMVPHQPLHLIQPQ